MPTEQRAKAAATAPPPAPATPAPDLSHIAEQLRPLAVPCSELTADPANARRHPGPNLAALTGSLRAYGQRKPVVVNRRTGTVEAGNGTLQAALALGWSHLAVVYVDDDLTTAAGFSVTGTIDLQSPLPDLNNSIAIQGPGASRLTVERAAGFSFASAIGPEPDPEPPHKLGRHSHEEVSAPAPAAAVCHPQARGIPTQRRARLRFRLAGA
jgi:hypothetical protein